MGSVNSCAAFNPLSTQYHAIQRFKNLKPIDKAKVVALTVLGILFTLGLGGVYCFRLAVYKFHILKTGTQPIADKVNDLIRPSFKKDPLAATQFTTTHFSKNKSLETRMLEFANGTVRSKKTALYLNIEGHLNTINHLLEPFGFTESQSYHSEMLFEKNELVILMSMKSRSNQSALIDTISSIKKKGAKVLLLNFYRDIGSKIDTHLGEDYGIQNEIWTSIENESLYINLKKSSQRSLSNNLEKALQCGFTGQPFGIKSYIDLII